MAAGRGGDGDTVDRLRPAVFEKEAGAPEGAAGQLGGEGKGQDAGCCCFARAGFNLSIMASTWGIRSATRVAAVSSVSLPR